MYYYSMYSSPIGNLCIASCEDKIVGLWIENQKFYMKILKDKKIVSIETKVILKTKEWLDRYFRGEIVDSKEIPIKFIGSSFQKEVWDILLTIPYGEVITYGDISKIICEKHKIKNMSSQAVGGAVGKNPISIIVPCHRVVGKNNTLVGYAGGTDKKKKLLEIEKSI